MKKYISLFVSALMAVVLASCSKDSEGLTGITYYPVIEIEGAAYDEAPAGVPYVDPGYSATMQGKDITDQVKVATAMDLNDPKPGFYSVVYSAVNPDGFSASATRYVLVTAEGDKVAGYYATSPESYRLRQGAQVFYGASFDVIVYDNGDGSYSCSDFLGGWYEQRAGYGSNYAAKGSFTVDADGEITLVDSHVAGWGDSLEGLSNAKFDAATSTISWTAGYAGMDFVVSMSK